MFVCACLMFVCFIVICGIVCVMGCVCKTCIGVAVYAFFAFMIYVRFVCVCMCCVYVSLVCVYARVCVCVCVCLHMCALVCVGIICVSV